MKRDRYEDVGRSIRRAYDEIAVAALPPACHRTLGAIVALVASWSRLEDRLTVNQLAVAARQHPKTTEKALRRLRGAGIIVYRGGCGRSVFSRVGLPYIEENGAASAPLKLGKREPLDTKGEPPGSKKGVELGSPPEKYSEKISRNGIDLTIDEPCQRCGDRPSSDDGERVLCGTCREAVAVLEQA